MVEQATAGTQQAVELVEVRVDPLGTDVFGHADRADRVERTVVDLPIVLEPDLDLVVESRLADPSAGVRRLFVADRHPDHVDVVMRCGVDGHRTPAASDIEQPRTGSASGAMFCVVQAELATDQLVLGCLGATRAIARDRTNRAQEYVIAVPRINS